MPRLDALPEPYATRLDPARDPAAWASRCRSGHEAQWIAWNICEDAWYRDVDLQRIQAAMDQVEASLTGPALLARCVRPLQRVREMASGERDQLPLMSINHIAASRFSRRYDLAPESAWDEGSLAGETTELSFAPGTRLRVAPRTGVNFAWITFEAGGRPVPRDPDEVMRHLGLPWQPSGGLVLRVEVPMGTLRASGAHFALPTIFDALDDDASRPLAPDWRARPEREQRPGEPWGYARDMQLDGPGLPEIIAEITSAGTMDAECIGTPRNDWSTRPYLRGPAPR